MTIKKNFYFRCFLIFALFLTFFSFYNTIHAATERIHTFSSNIAIQKDGILFVTEHIVYDFGTGKKHGIFRDVPLTALNGPDLQISLLSVADETGKPYSYATSISNNIFHIKIGDPDTLVDGIKTYIIRYQVYGAIRTFEDHHELYWNVTGNQWQMEIKNADASIDLPAQVIPNLTMTCFTGLQDSTQKNCTFTEIGDTITYSTTQALKPTEGLTIVLGVPLGYINTSNTLPFQSNQTTGSLKTNNILFSFAIPLFSLIFILGFVSLLIRRFKMKKPKPIIPKELKGKPIIVEYNPPDNLPPIEVGTLLDRRVDIADISSVIMDLAVRGYIKIRYVVREIPFWPDKKDFELIKLKNGDDLSHPADKIIFDLLFTDRDSITLSTLKEQKATFQSDIKKIQESTEQHLLREGYFDRESEEKSKKINTYLAGMSLFLLMAFFVLKILPDVLQVAFVVFSATVVIIIFILLVRLHHRLTSRGISTLGKILGFREFLQLTKKDKLQLLNAPSLQPEMFEKFLPYAMVLGVEDKWAETFEGIYNAVPNWYEDPTAPSFNSHLLARNLMLFNGSFNHVFKITTSRSSSGFSGGGFSGGGSGGGGGGSW